jgi:hypothetical protein
MQTALEVQGIESRIMNTLHNDYLQPEDQNYSEGHSDAKANGDPQGKGVGGSHGHYIPDPNRPHIPDYTTFNTHAEAGGQYDIMGYAGKPGGRDYLSRISMYSKQNEYGPHLVDTRNNIGQYRVPF